MRFISLLLLFLFLATPVYADSLVNNINTQRTYKLTENVRLDKTATIKACDMLKNKYWAHIDLQGRYSWYLFRQQGFYGYLGEDMAKGFSSNQGIVNAWLNSPTHRTVMLDSVYKYVGIGRCGKFVVAHFAN
jgi:uncharacterized protein YkwD